MVEKWLDIVKGSLEAGDEMQYHWDVQYDKKNGYLVLSKKKVLFVEEHGLLHKTATLILDDPYKNISKTEIVRNQLELIDADGARRIFNTNYSLIIQTKLEDLRKQAVPESR